MTMQLHPSVPLPTLRSARLGTGRREKYACVIYGLHSTNRHLLGQKYMSNQLSIKIDFHQNRSNPQAIFEAMALYIKFHTDIGQILFNSINEQINFNFELDDIERSSLLSKISPKGLLNWAENFYSKFSEETFREIADLDDEISPSDIDNLSSKIEDKIQADLNPPFAVEINRSALSSALKTLTAANSKLLDDEPVTFSRNTSNVIHINTRDGLHNPR